MSRKIIETVQNWGRMEWLKQRGSQPSAMIIMWIWMHQNGHDFAHNTEEKLKLKEER